MIRCDNNIENVRRIKQRAICAPTRELMPRQGCGRGAAKRNINGNFITPLQRHYVLIVAAFRP